MKTKSYDVFISYRREGGQETAVLFYERLTQLGYRVAYDIESLRSGVFDEQILEIIRSCKDVVVVLGPGALDRCANPDDWVRQEVACALAARKNVVPLLLRGFTFPSAEDLPEDMRELSRYNGVGASMEHFDSTFERVRGRLTAHPHGRLMRRIAWLSIAAILGLGVLTCTVFRDRVFPYPVTQNERQRVGNLVGFVSLLATTYNDLNGGELELVGKARTGIEVGSRSEYDSAVDIFRKRVEGLRKQFDSCNAHLPKVILDLESMPVDSAGFPMFVENVRQDLDLVDDFLLTLGNVVDPKNVMQKVDRLRLVELKQEGIECRGRIFACGIMGIFCNISEKALVDLKKIALQWVQFPDLARTWLRDEKEIENVGSAHCNRLEKIMVELATIVGNENVGLSNDREALRRTLIEQGASLESADAAVNQVMDPVAMKKSDDFLKSLGMPDLPTPRTPEELRSNLEKIGATPEQIERMVARMKKMQDMKDQLASAQKGIEDAKARARVKFAPKSTDDARILWGKVLRFLSLDMRDDALNAVSALRKKNSAEFPPDVCTAAEAFVCTRGRLPFVSGVMVAFFESPATSHAIFRLGDIIVEQDGKAVHFFNDCRMKDGSTYVVYRYDGHGGFTRLTLTMPPGQPRVATVDLMESKQ